MFWGLWRRLWGSHEGYVSSEWLKQQDAAQSRVEFHGVKMQWPVRKRINEAASWNTRRLRRREVA